FRHFIMSFSFANTVRETVPLRGRFLLSLGLTDESFAVAAIEKDKSHEKNSTYFYSALFLTAYLSWLAVSFLGGLLGEVIAEQLNQSMGIVLYVMFIGLLIPVVKVNVRLVYISVLAMLVNLIFSKFISEGWAIFLGNIICCSIGIYFLKEKKV